MYVVKRITCARACFEIEISASRLILLYLSETLLEIRNWPYKILISVPIIDVMLVTTWGCNVLAATNYILQSPRRETDKDTFTSISRAIYAILYVCTIHSFDICAVWRRACAHGRMVARILSELRKYTYVHNGEKVKGHRRHPAAVLSELSKLVIPCYFYVIEIASRKSPSLHQPLRNRLKYGCAMK